MQATLYGLTGLVPFAALGAVTGLYCALAADAYVGLYRGGEEADSNCLRKALSSALRRTARLSFFGRGRRTAVSCPVPPPAGAPPLRHVPVSFSATPSRCVPISQPPVLVLLACSISMAVGFAVLGLLHGHTVLFFARAAAIAVLLALALIDIHTRLLPDALTMPLMWAGLALAWSGCGVALADAVTGAMMGYGFLWSLFWVFKCLSGREGMGYGDFKLLAALGAWLGWQALAMVLLVACVMAVLFAMLRQRSFIPYGAYPFGPFLAASGTAAFLSGQAGPVLIRLSFW